MPPLAALRYRNAGGPFLALRVAAAAADKVEQLKEVRIFEGCRQRQLRRIARIARVFDPPAGTMLTRVDEPGDEFFLILDGTASVDVATEKRVPLRPGAFFGEMSLLEGF